MKLKNKKSGIIADLSDEADISNDGINIVLYCGEEIYCYNSLAELNAEWIDYEEPKEYYWIDYDGKVKSFIDLYEWQDKMKEIGNYFNSKEDAYDALDKLKAYKRLKEAGFKFSGWAHTPITKSLTGYNLHIKAYSDKLADYMDDLQFLFGGGE